MHTVCIFIYANPSIGSLGGVRWWRQAAVRVQGSKKWCSGPLQGGFGFSGSERFCSCLAGQNPRRLLSYSQFCICWVWSTYVDQCWLAARIWRASVKQLKLIFHIYIYIYITICMYYNSWYVISNSVIWCFPVQIVFIKTSKPCDWSWRGVRYSILWLCLDLAG